MNERAQPKGPTLETNALSKSFGGLRAVRDVSITLNRGELHAVIGPNGAGKSTFVKLIAGEFQPTSGSIALEGRDITREPVHARAHLGIARSFQRTDIFGSLSVIENVRLAAQAVHLPARRVLGKPALAYDLVERAERMGILRRAQSATPLSEGARTADRAR